MEDPSTTAQPAQSSPEQDEHVRTRLLNAAVRVFDRKGYAGASVREIAEAAGVTKPALYYHYGSKEGVLLAILRQAEQQFSDAVARAVGRTGSARDRIVGLCGDIYGLFGQNVPVARVAHAVFLGRPDGAPPFDVTVFEARFRRAVERMATDGVAAGEFGAASVPDIALAVMGILEGPCYHARRPGEAPIRAAWQAFLLALARTPPAAGLNPCLEARSPYEGIRH